MVVAVVVNDDEVVEATEEFLVAMVQAEGETGVRLTSPTNETVVTIEDDGDGEDGDIRVIN